MSTKKAVLAEKQKQEVRRAVDRAMGKMSLRSTDQRAPNLAEFSDSDDEAMKNRIGDVPLEWYADEDHIGYDVYGNKIMRKDQGDSIDKFLARTDDPNAYRTVYDALNDEKVVLTDEELSIINRIRKGKFPHRDFNPDEDYTAPMIPRDEILGNAFEPKARFVPSRWEAKKVLKYVHSIRNGWLRDPRKPAEPKKSDETEDIWGDDDEAESLRSKHRLLLPPHKLPLPGHAESFNPPVEYLWTKKEHEQQMALDPENRMYNFEPTKNNNLRNVPAYADLVKERYSRCLDLFLSVRVRRKEKLNIDPNALLPQLPKPKDLKPFPTTYSLEYIGHTGPVRSIDVDPTGQWLVSGAEDGSVRVWEITTARCIRLWNMKEQIVSVSWNPNPALPLIAVGLSTGAAILHTGTGTPEEAINAEHLLRSAPVIYKKGINIEKAAENASETTAGKAFSKAEFMAKIAQWVSWWKREVATDSLFAPVTDGVDAQGVTTEEKAKEKDKSKKRFREMLGEETEDGDYEQDGESYEDDEEYDTTAGLARLLIRIDAGVSVVTWHGKGDYLATVSPVSTSRAVMVHRLTSAASQLPFAKNKGLIQSAQFHPTKPLFIVATQRHVKMYNLSIGKLVRTLQSTSKWISSVAVHPKGEHIIVGGYDRRVNWFDLDLSSSPYKTLKYHRRAVREVTFHRKFPLFASCSDDGQIHIMHNTVYNDLVTNPLIVPVKIINAHIPVDDIGATQIIFHPKQPWIFSCAADKTIRMFS